MRWQAKFVRESVVAMDTRVESTCQMASAWTSVYGTLLVHLTSFKWDVTRIMKNVQPQTLLYGQCPYKWGSTETVVGNWCFDNLSGNLLQCQMKSCSSMCSELGNRFAFDSEHINHFCSGCRKVSHQLNNRLSWDFSLPDNHTRYSDTKPWCAGAPTIQEMYNLFRD